MYLAHRQVVVGLFGECSRVQRVLVTGGCGFIGSEVVRRIVGSRRSAVLNIDALTYAAQPDAVAGVADSPRYAFAQLDICHTAELTKRLQDFAPDLVLHLAAETHVDRSIDSPADFVRTNVLGTASLLEATLTYWQKLPAERSDTFRFIQISTDEVFGTLSLDEPRRFQAGDAYAPNSPYAASKAAADHLTRAWYRTYGLPVIVSHCSNNFGPWQFPEKLIPTIIMAGMAGRAMPVYGTGANVRDWLSVEDHVAALLTLAVHGVPGRSYAAGGFGAMRNLDLVRLLCQLLDEARPDAPHCPHEKLIEFVSDRPGHDLRYDVDPGPLRDEFGWRPARALTDALRDTLAWYLARGNAFTENLQDSGLTRRGLTPAGAVRR